MRKRKQNILIAILISLMLIVSFLTYHQQAQDRLETQQDEPTHIKEGLITEKQRKHSKLYEKPLTIEDKNLIRNRNLVTSAKKSKEGIDVIVIGEDNTTTDDHLLPTQELYLQKNNCKADTIVVGKITAKTSQLTQDFTSVFTDYNFVVSDILRNNLSLKIQPSASILVTRAGGKVEIDNRIIDYIIKSKKRFLIGNEYLIFLNYLPESESFKIVEPEGIFEISGNQIKRFSNTNYPYKNLDKDSNNFINFVRNTLNQCSSEEGNK